jgi:hypothetical protein
LRNDRVGFAIRRIGQRHRLERLDKEKAGLGVCLDWDIITVGIVLLVRSDKCIVGVLTHRLPHRRNICLAFEHHQVLAHDCDTGKHHNQKERIDDTCSLGKAVIGKQLGVCLLGVVFLVANAFHWTDLFYDRQERAPSSTIESIKAIYLE